MRKSSPMSFRKLFVVAAAVAALGVADPALVQAVTVTNEARRDAYARRGQAAGTTGAVAGARMFESQLLPRISSGEWYRNAQGQWVQR